MYNNLINLYINSNRHAQANIIFKSIPVKDRNITMYGKILSMNAKKGNMQEIERIISLKTNLLNNSELDLHWKGIVIPNREISEFETGGVPLEFAKLLVSLHKCNKLSVVTGYRSGQVLQKGLISWCKEKGYRVKINEWNSGVLNIKKN